MRENLEIDALLMGALYGENTPAENERLSKHLASHPHDQATFDAWQTLRTTFRASTYFTAVAEPAHASSAVLLQAAVRHAPSTAHRAQAARASNGQAGLTGGLWTKVSDWFGSLARQPALAAAAALVLVGGAAGVLALRNRGQDSVLSGDRVEMTAPSAVAPAGAPDLGRSDDLRDGASTGGSAPEPAQAADLDRAKDQGVSVALTDAKQQAELARASNGRGQAALAPEERASAKPDPGSLELQKKVKAERLALEGIEATVAQRDVMAFAEGEAGAAVQTAPAKPASKSDDADGDRARDDVAAPSTEAPAPKATTATTGPVGGAVAPVAPAAPMDEQASAARALHLRMIGLVESGKCTQAGQLGQTLASQHPDYFKAFVANDRKLKACRAYIDGIQRARSGESKSPATADSK